MTKTEKKVAELEKRVKELEARPQVIALPVSIFYESPPAQNQWQTPLITCTSGSTTTWTIK